MHFLLAHKISALVVTAVVGSAVSVAYTDYTIAAAELREEAGNRLTALLEARQIAIGDYLSSIRRDLASQANNPFVLEALGSFMVGWQEIGPDAATQIRRLFIDGNPHPPGARQRLDHPNDTSIYSLAHNRFHPRLRGFAEQYGYRDVVLVDAEGRIVYSVMKQADFGTDLRAGPYARSGLGKAYAAIAADPEHTREVFLDFEHYGPSDGRPTGVIAAPLLDDTRTFIGVLAFEMPIDRINSVMQVSAGLGQTGDSFIVGPDYLLRSDSRRSTVPTLLTRREQTPPVAEALAGHSGLTVATLNTDGQPTETLTAYAPLDFLSVKWAVVASAGLAEVYAPVTRMRNKAIVHGLIVAMFGALICLAVTRRLVVAPLTSVTEAMRKIAGGDREVTIPVLARTDEIGDMARVLALFRDSLTERDRLSGRLATAITAFGGGFALFDGAQRLIIVNEAMGRLAPTLAPATQPGTLLATFVQALRDSGPSDGVAIPPGLEHVMVRAPSFDTVVPLGDDRWADLSARRMPHGGVLVTLNDVTGHKRAADAYRNALDKERELNVQQREFVSMTSHEFRTPLTIIDTAAQRLNRRRSALSDAELGSLGQTIRDAVARMIGLIEMILSSSRLDSGKLGFQPQPVDLRTILQEICGREATMSRRHRFDLELDGLPARIHGDAILLNQIFTNLLSNAVKYSPQGGLIRVDSRLDGDSVAVAVEDSGVGIPADDIPRLSQRFFRARTSTGIVGTGLGLYLARNFIEMHGGRLEIISNQGQGSIFTVILPINTAGPEISAMISEPVSPTARVAGGETADGAGI